MNIIFQYDLDRLTAYSLNPDNKIEISLGQSYNIFSFLEVGYFNYTFVSNRQPLATTDLDRIKTFYLQRNITKHKILISHTDFESATILDSDNDYQHTATIVKTRFKHQPLHQKMNANDVEFETVDSTNIEQFTITYLNSFDAVDKDYKSVARNFKLLLDNKAIQLLLLKSKENIVGINVLYHSNDEVYFAGGAILPEYRNKGFHKASLALRINQAMEAEHAKDIISWAYKSSVSVENMLKMKMQVAEEFLVYEYCK